MEDEKNEKSKDVIWIMYHRNVGNRQSVWL